MINIYREWKSLSQRILGITNIAKFVYDAPTNIATETKKPLREEIKSVMALIKEFKSNFPSLDATITDEFNRFIEENDSLIQTDPGSMIDLYNLKIIVGLSILRERINYYFKDNQVYIRKTVEIAFQHLQRSLIVDLDLQSKWKMDLKETSFEKLGGVHLLLHKIWGFKVNADGERTDLVLSEKINDKDFLNESADGLVLTEWKFIKDVKNVDNYIEAAKNQAKKYSAGSLSAIELSNYYFLIMVSEDYLPIPNNQFTEDHKIFRVINIAYSPNTPSVAAKKKHK